uniref:DUF1664 domain-containing protein n=1 Tax=Aplanochytrium stocchinoi TaxID=215587 RepID=A0A7S3PHN5_9STRA|mmetsp:Transcript_17268/g.21266  ORF Transcript_17268/g.21266 Transcript_17268/m.21266 type:complete len:318 (+) Transcript_17268:358-1311(+)
MSGSIGTLARGGLFGASAGLGALTIVNNPDGLNGVVQNLGSFALNSIARPGGSTPVQMDVALQPLSQQMLELSSEVARLRAQGQMHTVYHAGQGGMSWYTIATVGGVTTATLYFMGYSWNDVMYVTKRVLKDAVEQLEEGLDQVGVALETTKRELSYKIGLLEDKMDETRHSLEEKLEAQVGDVKRELAGVGDDVKIVANMQGKVQTVVEDLETQMQTLGHKIEHSSSQLSRANHGIYLLCNVVAENIGGKKKDGRDISTLYDELVSFTQSAVDSIQQLPSRFPKTFPRQTLTPTRSASGRTGLQLLAKENSPASTD